MVMNLLLTKSERLAELSKRYQTIKNFNGKMWMIGFGAVGPALMYMILKVFAIKPENITVFDKDIRAKEKVNTVNKSLNFINVDIKEDNYKTVLQNVEKDDIIIDCSYNIYTLDLLELCQEKGCSYINSSIEDWSYMDQNDVIKYSLMYKRQLLEKLNNSFDNKKTNFLVSMGCNPGNVSIWAKFGLDLIKAEYNRTHDDQIDSEDYGEIAYKLGVDVIHISEKDTQKTKIPKREDEYCNTWSSTAESMYEEGIGPVEVSWGTHEKTIPHDAVSLPKDNGEGVILKRRGISTFGQSYVPISKNFIGMLIRHDEAFTIGRELSYYQDNKLIHKPSVYYVYHPCDSTISSFHELREKNLKYQSSNRLLTHDITEGNDELGLTFFLNNGDIYWVGSLLDIEEARELYNNEFTPYVNATLTQVVGGFLGGLLYIVDEISAKRYHGLLSPDDLPYEKILNFSLPFFGEFVFKKVTDWTPMKYDNNFPGRLENKITALQFENFIVDY
jgi:homospermidine synthase